MQVIDKLAWVCIKDKKALFVRSHGKDVFFNPGGKREEGESDTEALVREIKEELCVELLPETITYVQTFTAPAHGEVEDRVVEIKCYHGDFTGELTPASEIAELGWLTSKDSHKVSAAGQLYLEWLKENNLID